MRRIQTAVAAGALAAIGTLTWRNTTQVASRTSETSPPMPQVQSTPFPDSVVPTPKDWTGHVFRMSQDYPQTAPPPESPWRKFDFRTHPREYMEAVLHYCYEGNIGPTNWDGAKNPVRRWYHAPWMHTQPRGREPIYGLTDERVSEATELSSDQHTRYQNWAVSMYNPAGGWVMGQVWQHHDMPRPDRAVFPPGTVALKLLLTEATEKDVPYLVGAMEWPAYIYTSPLPDPLPPNYVPPDRHVVKLRLLQFDFAVRDPRAYSGWVYGTFCYNGKLPGAYWWDRMAPVGLMWGNDPYVVRGGDLKETWINPDTTEVPPQHLGWDGRLNGPVDNRISSCISCHQTAEVGMHSTLVPPGYLSMGSDEWMRWFRNLKPLEPFDCGYLSCDTSLQLSGGLQHYYKETGQPVPVPTIGVEYRVTRSGEPDLMR